MEFQSMNTLTTVLVFAGGPAPKNTLWRSLLNWPRDRFTSLFLSSRRKASWSPCKAQRGRATWRSNTQSDWRREISRVVPHRCRVWGLKSHDIGSEESWGTERKLKDQHSHQHTLNEFDNVDHDESLSVMANLELIFKWSMNIRDESWWYLYNDKTTEYVAQS